MSSLGKWMKQLRNVHKLATLAQLKKVTIFRLKSDSVQHLPVSKQIPMLRVLCCQCEDMDFKGLKRQTSLRSMSPFCTDLKGSEVFDRQSAAARRLQRQESVPANRLVSQLDLIWDFDASATTNRYPQASIIYDLFFQAFMSFRDILSNTMH